MDEERDLRIIISNDLKVPKQCFKVVKTANRVLGMIYRFFVHRTSEIILPLYKSIVRPHLDYCVQEWCPYFKKDIKLLEKVQHKASKIMTDLRNNPEDRLRALHLMTLKIRCNRGDLIEAFKIMKGHVDYSSFFSLSGGVLRGYSMNKSCSSGTGRRDVYAICPAPRIFNESNILWTLAFGHRPNSNQARICVLGFSANRVWLVSRFYIFYNFVTLLQSTSVLNTKD